MKNIAGEENTLKVYELTEGILNSYSRLDDGEFYGQRFAHTLNWMADNYPEMWLDPRDVVRLTFKFRKRPTSASPEVKSMVRNWWHISKILETKYNRTLKRAKGVGWRATANEGENLEQLGRARQRRFESARKRFIAMGSLIEGYEQHVEGKELLALGRSITRAIHYVDTPKMDAVFRLPEPRKALKGRHTRRRKKNGKK